MYLCMHGGRYEGMHVCIYLCMYASMCYIWIGFGIYVGIVGSAYKTKRFFKICYKIFSLIICIAMDLLHDLCHESFTVFCKSEWIKKL